MRYVGSISSIEYNYSPLLISVGQEAASFPPGEGNSLSQLHLQGALSDRGITNH